MGVMIGYWIRVIFAWVKGVAFVLIGIGAMGIALDSAALPETWDAESIFLLLTLAPGITATRQIGAISREIGSSESKISNMVFLYSLAILIMFGHARILNGCILLPHVWSPMAIGGLKQVVEAIPGPWCNPGDVSGPTLISFAIITTIVFLWGAGVFSDQDSVPAGSASTEERGKSEKVD